MTLTGVNKDELGGLGPPQGPVTAESFAKQARERYGKAADEFLKLYPAGTDDEAKIAQKQSTRDQALTALYLWATVRARTAKTPVYEYLWDHAMPGPDTEQFGAFHTSEVPYVMNTLYMSDRPFTDADRKIADVMSSYWANFAAAGDPNGKGLPPVAGDWRRAENHAGGATRWSRLRLREVRRSSSSSRTFSFSREAAEVSR